MSVKKIVILLLSLLFLSSINSSAKDIDLMKTDNFEDNAKGIRLEIKDYKTREEKREKKAEDKKRANITKAWNKIKAEELIKAFGSQEEEDYFQANVAPLAQEKFAVKTPRIADWSLVFKNKNYPDEGKSLVVSKYYPNGAIFPDNKTGRLIWYEEPAYLVRITEIAKVYGKVSESEIIFNKAKYIFSSANKYINRDETLLINEKADILYRRNYKADRFLDYWIGKKPRVDSARAEIPLFYDAMGLMTYEVPLVHDREEIINLRANALLEAGFSDDVINKVIKSDNLEIATGCLAIDDDYTNNLHRTKGGYGYAQALINTWTIVYDKQKKFPNITLGINIEGEDKSLNAIKPTAWFILKDGEEKESAPKQKLIDCLSKKQSFISRLQPVKYIIRKEH